MASTPLVNYSPLGTFDRKVYLDEFSKQFKKDPHYTAGAAQNSLTLLKLIESDKAITDVRWAAYMLATTMKETTSPERMEKPAKNKKGIPLRDKNGHLVMVKYTKWVYEMAPVDEILDKKPRGYHEPVKIKVLADGSVRVTEHDGDQFLAKIDGGIKPLTKHAKEGAKDGGPAHARYENDDGIEHVYFGRGYVQLTWWSHYAKAGVAMGCGLKFLIDPESVKTPEVAYSIMSYGMVTGEIFANNHCFTDYFCGAKTDYVGARRMVNGTNCASEIAGMAEKFAVTLLRSRMS